MKIFETQVTTDLHSYGPTPSSSKVFRHNKLRIDSYWEDLAETFRRCSSIVAIPVQNEESYIAKCLIALAQQSGGGRYGIVLLLNNCTDRTLAVVRDVAVGLPMPLLATDAIVPARMSNAGFARRLAMEFAARLAAPGSVLMTTDADGEVYPDWIAANLAALRAGADVVAGRVELDGADAIRLPSRLQEDDEKECMYDRLLDEIHAKLDPDPADPLPRHTEHAGASIAVRLPAYRKAGGIPAVPVGEDRAFIEALRKIDARIRHSRDVRVVVSGRIIGRAVGGMADAIRRRLIQSDEMLDGRLEPARIAAERAWMRGFLRQIWSGGKRADQSINMLAIRSKVPAMRITDLLAGATFGEAWSQLESRSPVLRKLPVLIRDLPAEMRAARMILDDLDRRDAKVTRGATTPADSPDCGAAQLS